MKIEVVDLVELARREKLYKTVFESPRMHTWILCYRTPGQTDEMHCHNADETFYVVAGECTMHFPDGGRSVMRPGQVAVIPGGAFYQLENTGSGPMIMMGNRSGPEEKVKIISYETRKDIREQLVKAAQAEFDSRSA